jgi:excisionase family DNA binding protein
MNEDRAELRRRTLLKHLFGTELPSNLESELLRTIDVAVLFHVTERTVTEWARKGRIPSVRTPGGHRRYPASGIRQILEMSDRHRPPAS